MTPLLRIRHFLAAVVCAALASVGVASAQSLDTRFDPGANYTVSAVAVQADGKILVGGYFTRLGGGGGTTPRSHIGRLNADGSVDATFDPGANGGVLALAMQADGKILVGGFFSTLGGGGTGTTPCWNLGRLNADGSLDTSFNPGANMHVYALAVQPDGKILVGGAFATLGGGGTGTTARSNIGRLNADGSLDTSFNPGANRDVRAVAVQADGKILVGGLFTMLGSGGIGTTPRNGLGRLNADGSLDTNFNPGSNNWVFVMALQPDGRILVGGDFTTLGGGGTGATPRSRLGRLYADGSLDTSFDPGANGRPLALAVQADGKILVGGNFTTLGGGGTGAMPRNRIGRLNADGSLDTSFDPGTDNAVWAVAGQADGKILVAGQFRRLGGGGTGTTARSNIGRLNADGAAPIMASPFSLCFGATKAGVSGPLTSVTPAQTVTVTFPGAIAAWTAIANQTWLQVTGGSAAAAGQFAVALANPGNVIAGSSLLTGTITIAAPTASNSPILIPVTLMVDQSGGALTQPPVGLVDSPAQNATEQVGAIGVTGWVVDDVGVRSVKIYRNCLAFEPDVDCAPVNGVNLVYIGDATLVVGARPDIEAIYATYPQANRAGWGYLLLTNMLPHIPNQLMFGGQGTLTLYVLAEDVEGHQRWLGRDFISTTPPVTNETPTTFTMWNDHIHRPFGAIDTPTQGQTVSGAFWNFGWTLTRDTNGTAEPDDILMPLDGYTQWVLIDGVRVGRLGAYNLCRGSVGSPVPAGAYCDDDVSSIFGNAMPQAPFTPRTSNLTWYRNLDAGRGPIGAYWLDTTTLTNGLHTIVWGVTDSGARAEGIGSRYFTVLNGSTDASSAGADAIGETAAQARGEARRLDGMKTVSDGVWGRTGFDVNTPYSEMAADETGLRRVQIPALGRLELWVGPVDGGYLVANGGLRALPIGSNLDAATGRFTWAAGLGYLGTYRLAFVRGSEQVLIDVTITSTSKVSEAHLMKK